jgi:hypothetical protein
MAKSFDIHGMFRLSLENCPSRIDDFFCAELDYFLSEKTLSPDMVMTFEKGISPSKKSVQLLTDMFYDTGRVYIKKNSSFLELDIRNWLDSPINVRVDPAFPVWWVWYAFERTMRVFIGKKGYSAVHAAAMAQHGNVHISCSMSGGGKTYYALEGMQSGMEFLGDDIVFLDSNSHCFCYPRRINVKHHHPMYQQAVAAHRRKYSIRRWLKNPQSYRTVGGESISIQAAIRRGIRGFLVAREEVRFCRLPYNDIVPTSNLLASGPIETMTLLLGGVDLELTNDWARGRIVDFLWKGNIYETLNHISPYIEALSCYGDNWCNAFFERTLDALKLQRRIIEQVSSTVAVTVEYRQSVK